MRILEAGERVYILKRGECMDISTNLPIYEEVVIQRVLPIYQVYRPETPNHTFDIISADVKGIIK